MNPLLIGMEALVIGFAIGAGFTVVTMLRCFKVHTKERWGAFRLEMQSKQDLCDRLTAENAKVRVALAAGEMTQEGKKVAAMTMAALDAVIGTEEAA